MKDDTINNDKKDSIESLKSVLKEAESIGRDIAEQGRKRNEVGQEIADIARSAKNVVNELPNGTTIHGANNEISKWRHLVDEGRKSRDAYSSLGGYLLMTSGYTASLGISTMIESTVPTLPPEVRGRLSWAIANFDTVFSKSADKERAVELMKNLGLHKSYHKERLSALEHFQIAYDALNRPVSGRTNAANTSLIPMREAIETVLDQLIASRPSRSNIDEAKRENKDARKIKAVVEQLKRDDVSEYQVEAWIRDWVDLKDKLLSPAKTKPMSRDEWVRGINQATVFLIGFLSGIDPGKLRKDL